MTELNYSVEEAEGQVSRKEKLLEGLSDADLWELAKSLRNAPVDSRATRHELIGMLKDTLSLEEIRRKRTGARVTRSIRGRKRKQFLAVLVTSLVLYSALVIGSTLILNNINPKERSVAEYWSKTFDIGQYSTTGAKGTLDGGYVMIGTVLTGTFVPETFLLKTDSTGNTEWYVIIPEQDAAYVDQTSDGGYIIGGPSSYSASSPNAWLVKTYSNGTVQWSNDNVGIGNNSISSVQETSDGGYIIAGSWTMSSFPKYWYEKTDQLGNLLWERVYWSFDNAYAFYAEEISDGGYIIAGSTPQGILLIRIDSGGAQLWTRIYNDVYPGQLSESIQQTSDGGCIIAGQVISYGHSGSGWALWLGKTDQDGNIQWQSTNAVNGSTITPCIEQTSDGGYILAVYTYRLDLVSPGGIVLVKTDSNGNLQWKSDYRKGKGEPVLLIQQNQPNGYLVAGSSSTEGWLAEVTLEPPSILPIMVPPALAISGLAIATFLIVWGRRLKRGGEGLQTGNEEAE
jgi:hypothetical protein